MIWAKDKLVVILNSLADRDIHITAVNDVGQWMSKSPEVIDPLIFNLKPLVRRALDQDINNDVVLSYLRNFVYKVSVSVIASTDRVEMLIQSLLCAELCTSDVEVQITVGGAQTIDNAHSVTLTLNPR